MGFSKNHPWSYFQEKYLTQKFRKIDKSKSDLYKRSFVGGDFQKHHPWQKFISSYGKNRYKALKSRRIGKKVTVTHINKNMKKYGNTVGIKLQKSAATVDASDMKLVQRYFNPEMKLKLLKYTKEKSVIKAFSKLSPAIVRASIIKSHLKCLPPTRLSKIKSQYNVSSITKLMDAFTESEKQTYIKFIIREYKLRYKKESIKHKHKRVKKFLIE